MFCKHCGEEIDDNSKFCKYCGKQLEDFSNPSSSIIIRFVKQHMDVTIILILWVLYAAFDSANYEPESYEISKGTRFTAYIVTPIIIGLIYWLYKKHCKYQIQLFDKSDTSRIKLIKYAFGAYTFCVPFSCMDSYLAFYFWALTCVWLIPTFVICGIYYYIQSRKVKKSKTPQNVNYIKSQKKHIPSKTKTFFKRIALIFKILLVFCFVSFSTCIPLGMFLVLFRGANHENDAIICIIDLICGMAFGAFVTYQGFRD